MESSSNVPYTASDQSPAQTKRKSKPKQNRNRRGYNRLYQNQTKTTRHPVDDKKKAGIGGRLTYQNLGNSHVWTKPGR